MLLCCSPIVSELKPSSAQATPGRAGLRVGLRGARLTATNEAHAPTAMEWSTLTSYPWGSVETDFMTVATCGPEVSTSSAAA